MLLKTLRRAGIAILTLAIAGFVFAQDNAQSLEDALANATETTIQEVTDNSNEFYGEFVTMDGEIGEFVNSYAFALGQSAAIDNDLVLVVNQSGEPFPPEIMTEARVTVTGRVHPSLIAVEEGAQTDFGGIFTGDTAVEDTIEAAGEEVAEEVDEEIDEELEEEQMEDSGMSEEEAEAQAEATEEGDEMMDEANEEANNDNVPEGDADEAPAMAAEGGNVNMVQYVQEGNFPEGFENYTIIEIHSVDQVQYREDGQEEIGN
jgi:hypothetical protein